MGQVQGNQSGAFSPLEILGQKHVLIIGSTGFLAKVALSMLLERLSLGRIYCLIRSQPSKSATQRFFDEVIGSEMMSSLRDKFGPSFDAYIHEKVEVLDGDISKPWLGLDDETLARLRRDLDLVINSAGLVNFNPPLDSAVDINARGALEVARFTQSLDRKRLVHISTCFVAGNQSGHIRENEAVSGFYPKKTQLGVDFDWQRELKDLDRAIKQVKDSTDDAALETRFRMEAIDRLKQDGREVHARTLRAAMTNQRRRYVAEELIRIGVDRAEQWGWPNIYTYTKALGEQAIAATENLEWAIVRPAIVESALEYPFPGWNEGMNTSAPLSYLGLHGQVTFPSKPGLILDVVPVDFVASATIAASAALVEGESSKVYQVSAGDTNPCTMGRTVTLVGLYKRRNAQKKEKEGTYSWLRARWTERSEPLPLSKARYQRLSSPLVSSLAVRARKVLDGMDPVRYGPFGGIVSEARRAVKDAQTEVDKVVDIFDLFLPFIWENKYVFRSDNTRALFARMNEADRALLPYGIEKCDWRHYWLNVHMPGLERWVFPKLEVSGPKRMPIPRSYRDLAELFESRTEEHARRVAFRILRNDDVADSFSYRDFRRAAHAVAEFLTSKGVRRGDRVMLASESRPEWGMSYFGIILAGATVVPVDIDLSAEELARIAEAAHIKGAIASEDLRTKLEGTTLPAPQWTFEEVFEAAETTGESRLSVKRSPEDVASIIFTSGTTGRPKGVMLTDRNFTSLTSRISALFHLNHSDSLLSVLPLHHTFEFSAGLLMPVASGASITYLEERTPDLLERAFSEIPPTGIVGVPAVWEALHRKISTQVEQQGKGPELLVRGLMRANRALRDKSPWNLGRWIFRPMHNALGGRVRMMVSGGAPLDPKLYKDFRGFGFSLYEGYGLTEASPVISVGWPRSKTPAGSVGWPLPGVEVRINDPDDAGVGEVIARGPTIMSGYLEAPEDTARTLKNGWLFTGDQGRLDDDGRLFIVGRKKDVIIDTGGKNVYPDEIEELYRGSSLIKELSVVGIPSEQGSGERVAALVVPDFEEGEKQELDREEVRARVREHFREVGSRLPLARRIKVVHLWEQDLPKTSTRKVKRPFIKDQLVRMEKAARKGRGVAEIGGRTATNSTVRRMIAAIAQREADAIRDADSLVDNLGFDSLMRLELMSALEEKFPKARLSQDEMTNVDTVGDVVTLVSRDRSGDRKSEVGDTEEAPIEVPNVVRSATKGVLGLAQRLTYGKLFDVDVSGLGNVPANRNFIVASNHTSHLDMGLVKTSLQGLGGDLVTLAAKDYFFDDKLRRTYFENFTNLLPIDRHGSLKKSLRLASESLRSGSSLLIFPEGTRSRSGEMTGFKPAVGFLCLNEKVDIVPMGLVGTHDVLPVGASVPKGRKLAVRIGPPLRASVLLEQTKNMSRAQAYRFVAEQAEIAVRKLLELDVEAEAEAVRAEPVRSDSVDRPNGTHKSSMAREALDKRDEADAE